MPLGCRFWQTASGNAPVREWLLSLDKPVRQAVGSDIRMLQEGAPMQRPLVGAFGKGLYEVVTSFAGREYRVLFCVVSSTMLLLHGFQKKTRKTPKADLNLARERQKEVMQ